MTEVELENRLACLERRVQANEEASNASYNNTHVRLLNLTERVNRLNDIVEAAITTAVHELIDYLRHDDIQNLDEAEFADAVKGLIFKAEEETILPYGGCGPYEQLSCNECPASKPSYLERGMTSDELIRRLREHGSTSRNGRMGDECRVPKNILNLAADRIEVLKDVR